MNRKMLGGLFLLVLCHATATYAGFEQEEAAEIQAYMDIFQGTSLELQKDACNELQWKGIADVRIYDLIAEKLQAILPASQILTKEGKKNMETAAWYAKGLGSSGMEKYLPVFEKMASSHRSKLQRYAREGTAKVGQYTRWNPVISDKKNFRADQPLQVNRFANMLRSEDEELKLIAVKRIDYDHVYNEYLLDILREETIKHHERAQSRNFNLELLKRMAQSLRGSKNKKYRDDLRKIEATIVALER
jgi:hypothetical protein